MTEARTNPMLRLMPSLTDVAFLLPLIFLFTRMDGAKTMLGDGDTGWHIRTGEWILAHGQVPQTDMFSFTMPGQPFYAWEWGWDVLFALIHKGFGLGGVVAVSILVICLTSALLYKLVYRRCGNPLVAFVLTAIATAGASMHWLARPHLFTLLFMIVFLWILDGVKGQAPGVSAVNGHSRTSALWLLPVLTIVWTNLHGAFFVGIILCGAYAGGELLAALIASDSASRKAAFMQSLPYVAATAGCAAASLINPYTYHLHEHIYKYLNDPFQLQYIGEFQGTNFQNAGIVFFEVMLVVGVGASIWYALRKQFTEVLLIAGWAHLALLMVRNTPLFLLVAAFVTARPVCAWMASLGEAPIAAWIRATFRTLLEIGDEIVPLERPWRVHVIAAAIFCVISLAIVSPAATGKLKPVYDPTRYPEAALPSISDPGQRVFTNDEWGDYLIYKLAPQGAKVYVDGRSDFYGGKFDQTYLDVLNVKYDWEKTLARYDVNTILLPTDAALAGALKESRRWRVVYDDGESIVFRPTGWSNSRMDQVSAATNGGEGGRDLTVAAAPKTAFRSHNLKKRGVNP